MKTFRGLYTALITPFDPDGEVNEEKLRELLHLQIDANVDGIVVLGTTGEAPTLKAKEKSAIIAIAREVMPKNLPLLVGTGSYSTAETIENSLEAKRLGADGLLIVTPYYNRPSQEGLYRHYQAVLESVDLPIVVYNIPARTGQNLQTETLIRLAEHPNICGVKEVSGQLMEVIEKLNISVLSGDDAMTLACAALGGDGIISVASNLIPDQMRALTHAALRGDMEEARERHYALMPLFRALSCDTNPIPIKAAMELAGMAVGGYRLPLCDMSAANLEKLRQILVSEYALNGGSAKNRTPGQYAQVR
jgi:4-hydroxy-tetrahydrodipicolinate synthase